MPPSPIPFAPEEWQRLQKEYLATIPQKISELEKSVAIAQKSPTKEALTALRMGVHKLAGSAGIYGFAEVSVLCKTLELEIVKISEQLPLSSPDPQWLSHLSHCPKTIEGAFYGK